MTGNRLDPSCWVRTSCWGVWTKPCRFIYLFFIHAAFLRLTKCSNDRPSLSSQHEWPYFIFITQRERSSAGQLHRLSLFHWKAININLWNASLWSESVVDQGMTGSSRRPDLLRLPQAVEFEGSLALWGLLTFSFLGRGPFRQTVSQVQDWCFKKSVRMWELLGNPLSNTEGLWVGQGFSPWITAN